MCLSVWLGDIFNIIMYVIYSVWVRECVMIKQCVLPCNRRGLHSFSKHTERVSGLLLLHVFLETSLSAASSFPSRNESIFIIFCMAFILSSLLLQNSDDNQWPLKTTNCVWVHLGWFIYIWLYLYIAFIL